MGALPFENVKIVSFCQATAGNSCATYLAEMGADLVKIESWTRGDPQRDNQRFAPGAQPTERSTGAKTSLEYVGGNRSQKAMTIDMSLPEGRELFTRIAAVADVVINNFAVGVMARWGLEYDTLSRINPRIIMVSMPGFGKTGPKKSFISYGAIIASFLGLTHQWGVSNGIHNDYVSGAYGAYAILAALAYRDRTGRGLDIDLGQAEAGATLMGALFLDYTVNRRDPAPSGNRIPGAAYSAVLRCAGADRWVAIELETEDDWRRFGPAIGRPDLAADPRFADPAERTRSVAALDAVVEEWLGAYTPHQAMVLLQNAGIAACAVQNAEDLYRDPQLWARDAIVEVDDPDFGRMQFVQAPHRLSATPARIRRPASRMSQYTAETLTRWLGMSEAERKDLADRKVI